MLSLPLALRLEKNKLVSTAPWLILIALTLPDASVIRLVRNTEDVTFGGNRVAGSYWPHAVLVTPALPQT